MVHHEHLVLQPRPESVRAGRHFVEALLDEWSHPELVDVAALLTSEALTNAVVHAGTPCVLEVYTDGELIVEVSDRDSTKILSPVAAAGLDSLLRDPDLDAEGGRGLAMIATLAPRWGIHSDPGGKTVWFAFDLPDSATSAA